MNLALFDFDGTITVGDTFIPFLKSSVRPLRLVIGGSVLSPVVLGYQLGLISAPAVRPIAARFAFQGREAAAVRRQGQQYAGDVLPGMIRRRAIERLEWHKRQGDHIVVVSASLDVYLSPWCRSIGVEVICTRLEERGGRLTGRYVGGDCSGREKLRRIRERFDLGQYPVVYAYGDTEEDREMLELAHVKYYRWNKIGDTSPTSSSR